MPLHRHVTPAQRYLLSVVNWTILATASHLAVQWAFRPETIGPAFLPAAVVTTYASYAGTRVLPGRLAPFLAGLGAAGLHAVLALLGAVALHRWAGAPRASLALLQYPGFALLMLALIAALSAVMAYSGRDDAARSRSKTP
jgi:hypothetical protein